MGGSVEELDAVARSDSGSASLWVVLVAVTLAGNALAFVSSPVFFWDSRKYLMAAEYFLQNGLNYDLLPLEVNPGYPILLAFFLRFFDEPFVWLVATQCMMGVLIDLMVVLIGRELGLSSRAAVGAGVVSAVMLDKVYLAAAVLTEIPFLFLFVASTWLFLRAWRRSSTRLFFVSFALFMACVWVRTAPVAFWYVPPAFWIAGKVLAESRQLDPSKGQHESRYAGVVGHGVLVVVGCTLLLTVLVAMPLKRTDIGLTEKMAISWNRAIWYSETARSAFEREHPQLERDFDEWVAAEQWFESDTMPLEPITLNPRKWRTFRESRWQWSKTPLFFQMGYYGQSFAEAANWQGRVAQSYLLRFLPYHIKDTLLETLPACLSQAMRPLERSLSRDPRSEVFRGSLGRESETFRRGDPFGRVDGMLQAANRKVGADVTGALHSFFEFSERWHGLLLVRLAILCAGVLGLLYYRSLQYAYVLALVLMIFGFNLFFGGALPRYAATVVPFSGLFLYPCVSFRRRTER